MLSPFTSSSKLDVNLKFSTRNDSSAAHVNQLGDSSVALSSVFLLSDSLSKFEVTAISEVLQHEIFSTEFLFKTALFAAV